MSLYSLVKNAEHPYDALTHGVARLTAEHRVPLTATLELSPVCNFRCPFCYARVSPKELEARGERVLRFADWKRYIDEALEMGTFKLTFTGGECMLHPDFKEIYRYAYEKGAQIVLLSNGSSLTEEIFQLFLECPPEAVYITLYGHSAETYQTVCGNGKYFEIVLNNIKRLNEMGFRVVMQFTADKDNLSDLEAVSDIARELDVKLRYGTAELAFRRVTGEMLDECAPDREETKEAFRNMFQKERGYSLEEFLEKGKHKVYFTPGEVREKGILCGAGRSSFCLNYRGEMQPCISLEAIAIPTKEAPLSECWKKLVAACDEVPCIVECTNCLHRTHCKHCIAAHYGFTKEFGKPAPQLCFKQLYPELAAEREARFAKDGYLYQEDLI